MHNAIKKLISNNQRILLILTIFISLLIHLFLAFRFEGTGDSGGWRLAGKTGLHNIQAGMGNGTVYDGNCPLLCSNWPPFTYHYYILMRWMYESFNLFNLPQWGFYKLLPVISTGAMAFLIYRSAQQYKRKNALFLSLLFVFHPISLYVSAYHGQREIVWLLFMMLATLFLTTRKYLLMSIMFGIGMSVKIPPLLMAPLLFLKIPEQKNRILFVLVVPTIFFLLNLPEIVMYPKNIFTQVFLYGGTGGWWGLEGILNKFSILLNFEISEIVKIMNKILQYVSIVFLSIYFYSKKTQMLVSMLGIILVTFVTSPIFAVQYLLWPIPFMIVLYPRFKKLFWIYTFFSTFAAMNSYGIFRIDFLERYLLTIPQNEIYYKLPNFGYPMDLFFPVWIISIIFLVHIVRESNSTSKP